MGLRHGDLRDLVYNIFEVDSFASKMGADKDIVTLSFSVKTKESADDLMNFFEAGYEFVLDADSTNGEQSDGTYKVFVEMDRDSNVSENIMELVNGLQQLTDSQEFKFRYYKNFRSKDVSQESLEELVPNDPSKYGIKIEETRIENYKEFFTKSYLDSIDLIENKLHICKKFADPLAFEYIDFGNATEIHESIEGKFDLMESYPEILFLTKYIGDYNISKYGDKLVFENQGKALVVKRI
jgi:hypothetical protein